MGSRSNPVPSDEAEIVVDQFGWRTVNEEQDRSRPRSDPVFTAGKAAALAMTAHSPSIFFSLNIFQHQLDEQ